MVYSTSRWFFKNGDPWAPNTIPVPLALLLFICCSHYNTHAVLAKSLSNGKSGILVLVWSRSSSLQHFTFSSWASPSTSPPLSVLFQLAFAMVPSCSKYECSPNFILASDWMSCWADLTSPVDQHCYLPWWLPDVYLLNLPLNAEIAMICNSVWYISA